MSIATISKPSLSPAAKPRPGLRSHRFTSAAANQEDTMATMFMTRLHDARLQHQFHRLIVLGKNRKVSHTYPLNRQITSVGRSRHNQVRIDDALVSAKHLTISIANNASVVNDLDSSNGTFINGQRLSGFQVLNDGDEIMIGKTIMQFAVRRQEAPGQADTARRQLFVNKRWFAAAAVMVCLTLAAAFVFQANPWNPQRLTAKALAPLEKTPPATQPTVAQPAARLQSPVTEASAANSPHVAQDWQSTYIQRALANYAAGKIGSARETLKILVTPGPQTPAAAQARQMLPMLDEIQQFHAQALKAQVQKKFTRALEYWDRLLALDSQLIGDRPSYFAIQAEQRVQRVSYDYALKALRQKNHKKARQLCQVILQINPQNKQALALLSKIESMT
jgi:predicted component of type VI protein secretion system